MHPKFRETLHAATSMDGLISLLARLRWVGTFLLFSANLQTDLDLEPVFL
jgi:hypothetical protein